MKYSSDKPQFKSNCIDPQLLFSMDVTGMVPAPGAASALSTAQIEHDNMRDLKFDDLMLFFFNT